MIKYFVALVLLIALIASGYFLVTRFILADKTPVLKEPDMNPHIIPISHATAVLRWQEHSFYIDPVGGGRAFYGQHVPNVILVTDIHGDHFNSDTLSAVIADATLIVPQAVYDQLPEELKPKAKIMKNGDRLVEQGFEITAVPMYNIPESDDAFHTRGRGNGYVVAKDGQKVYIAGDTSGTPEMRSLQGITIALVPMNLPYTMTVEEAAEATLAFKPKQVYPYHYRNGEGAYSDVERFKQLVNSKDPSIAVTLAKWY